MHLESYWLKRLYGEKSEDESPSEVRVTFGGRYKPEAGS